MKMVLKNKAKFKLKFDVLNKKNYFIFLISLFVIGLTSGIVFFVLLNNAGKEEIVNNVNSYFTLSDNYNYLSILLDSFKNNFSNVIILWLLGISVIGIFIIIFLYFIEGFSIGFIISSIFYSFKYKGIVGSILYLFPGKLLYLLIMFILTFFAGVFSFNLIKNIIKKDEQTLNIYFRKYLKILGLCLILALLVSFLETFITPLMIKAWTFLIK